MSARDELLIESEFHAARDLLRSLVPRLHSVVALKLRRRDTPFRAEPSVLVATSSGDPKLVGELVAALLAVVPAPDRASSTIQLKDRAGIVAEVPASASPEQVSHLLRPVGSRRVTHVYIADVEQAAAPAEPPLRPLTILSGREDARRATGT
jgi:hypothetical protein